MPEQLPIMWPTGYQLREEFEFLSSEFARVVHHVTPKEFCYAVDASASALSHALRGSERHYIQAIWLLHAIKVAPDLRLASALLRPARLEPQPIAQKTPEQRVVELEAFIRKNSIVERAAKEDGLL
jgi:hypothetical protein